MDSPTSLSARNKTNYLKAKEAFNNRDIDTCIQFYAPGHEMKPNGSKNGRGDIRAFFESLHNTWADVQITVEHLVAEGDWVMGRSVAVATHSNTVLGVPPTNKKIVATFWDLHRFKEDGMIVETWNLIDNLAIMQQLGILK